MRHYDLMKIGGIAVRLHPTFVGLAIVIVLTTLNGAASFSAALLHLLVPALLFVTVVWHEFGHVLAARALGVPVIDVVLTPLGGQARLYSLHDKPREELRIALAGPLSNLLVAVPMLAGFLITEPQKSWYEFLRLLPKNVGEPREWAYLVFSFHFFLGTLNLLPIFPMDGGRILRAGLAHAWGVPRATRFACRIGTLAALAMILQPFLMPGRSLWILPFVGLFLLWTGFLERLTVEKEALFGQGKVVFHTFKVGPSGVERPPEGPRFDDPNVIDAPGQSRRLDE